MLNTRARVTHAEVQHAASRKLISWLFLLNTPRSRMNMIPSVTANPVQSIDSLFKWNSCIGLPLTAANRTGMLLSEQRLLLTLADRKIYPYTESVQGC